jgi:hypothetical protein
MDAREQEKRKKLIGLQRGAQNTLPWVEENSHSIMCPSVYNRNFVRVLYTSVITYPHPHPPAMSHFPCTCRNGIWPGADFNTWNAFFTSDQQIFYTWNAFFTSDQQIFYTWNAFIV